MILFCLSVNNQNDTQLLSHFMTTLDFWHYFISKLFYVKMEHTKNQMTIYSSYLLSSPFLVFRWIALILFPPKYIVLRVLFRSAKSVMRSRLFAVRWLEVILSSCVVVSVTRKLSNILKPSSVITFFTNLMTWNRCFFTLR